MLKYKKWFELALLHIHCNMEIDLDEIIAAYLQGFIRARRMQLANILSE